MLDVAIIADMSDSMSDDDAKDLKLPLEDLVNQLQLTAGGHHMALLAYSDQVLVKTDLTGDPTPIQASVQNLKPQGGPADPALALKDMVALMEGPQGRPGVHKTCILITDETSPDPAETARQAAIARSKGIELRVLSVSKDQNDPVDKEARQLVGDKEHVLHADTYGQLAGVMDLASMLLLSSCPDLDSTTQQPPATPSVATTLKHTVQPASTTEKRETVTQPKTTQKHHRTTKKPDVTTKKQDTTTEKPTTQKPTTHKPTTQKPTTHKPTTHKPTTHKPTTHKPTTQKPTTQKPTTQKPTTQKPSTTTEKKTVPQTPTTVQTSSPTQPKVTPSTKITPSMKTDTSTPSPTVPNTYHTPGRHTSGPYHTPPRHKSETPPLATPVQQTPSRSVSAVTTPKPVSNAYHTPVKHDTHSVKTPPAHKLVTPPFGTPIQQTHSKGGGPVTTPKVTPVTYHTAVKHNTTPDTYHTPVKHNTTPDTYHTPVKHNTTPDTYHTPVKHNTTPDTYHTPVKHNTTPDTYHTPVKHNTTPDTYQTPGKHNTTPDTYHTPVKHNTTPDTYHTPVKHNTTPDTYQTPGKHDTHSSFKTPPKHKLVTPPYATPIQRTPSKAISAVTTPKVTPVTYQTPVKHNTTPNTHQTPVKHETHSSFKTPPKHKLVTPPYATPIQRTPSKAINAVTTPKVTPVTYQTPVKHNTTPDTYQTPVKHNTHSFKTPPKHKLVTHPYATPVQKTPSKSIIPVTTPKVVSPAHTPSVNTPTWQTTPGGQQTPMIVYYIPPFMPLVYPLNTASGTKTCLPPLTPLGFYVIAPFLLPGVLPGLNLQHSTPTQSSVRPTQGLSGISLQHNTATQSSVTPTQPGSSQQQPCTCGGQHTGNLPYPWNLVYPQVVGTGGLVVPVSLVPVGFLTIPGVLPTGNKHAGCQHTISPKPLSTVTPSLSPPTPSTPASTPLPTTVTTTQASSKVTATTAPLATSSIRSTSHTAPVTVTKYGTHTPGTRMTVTPTLTPPATPTPSPTRLTEAVTTPTQPAKTTPPFGLNNTVVPSGACDDCLMVNGVGYKAHWARCDAFLQCQVLADHTVMGTVHYCPHGLHWNRAALTCTRPLQAACSMDRCLHSTQRMFPAVNNCRGYWVCQSGRSEGKCCPPGYSFGGRIGCIPDTACQDSCGVTTSVPRACDKRVVPRMPLTFEQYIPGAGWQLMFCAPGTAYNHSTCGCTDFRANSAIPNTCQAELYLPFKGGVVKDESGNNFVLNEGVKVINGAGYFNGRAVLRVPRFANTDYGDYVLIRLRYKQDGGGGGGGPQALVANGDCLKPSSLYMVAGQKSTSFGSVTTTGHAAVVNVPNSGGGGWKEAVMYVDRQTLTGSVDNFSMQTLFTGSLAGGHCALQFGSGTSFSHFKGFMDDITVYLCRPDTL